MAQYLRPHLLLIVSLLAGVVIGVAGTFAFTPQSSVPDDVRGDIQDEENPEEESLREKNTNYKFISPLLTCGIDGNFTSSNEARALRAEIDELLEQKKDENSITNAGVYVRELNDGVWFGINETENFTPGSLLKVPLALSLLQKTEDDTSFGRDNYEYEGGAPDIQQTYPPLETVEVGKTYSFDQLLRLSVIYSDNVATLLLSQLIDRQLLNESYLDLGIETPDDGDSYTMSVRTYASFFRILFNGTYLTHENSEYLLSLLAQSTFNEGIVAGVPDDIVIAHKFGERTGGTTNTVQLHDCGIVYAKDNPYVLCVMLRGQNIKALATTIADISHIVYEGLAKK